MSYENEQAVIDALMNRINQKSRGAEKKSEVLFKSSNIAKDLSISSYQVRTVLMKLEKEEKIERTELSSTITLWRTCFRNKGLI